MSDLNPAHVQWQKNLLDSLQIGGRWGVPQSGAQISKVARDMVFIDDRGNDESLIAAIIAHIEAAGYRVANTKKPDMPADDGGPSA